MANTGDKEPSEEVHPLIGQRFARNLDWNLLRVFYEIVQAGGISQAARRTNRKQPAISMALRRLEDHIGARLCHRGAGGFELTAEGELMAEVCESLYGAVSLVPRSMADAATAIRGRIRIQLISNLVDPAIDKAIEEFHKANELVEVFVSVATWDVIQRSVIRNEIEIGIAPAHHKDPGLSYEVIFREVYRPYCGHSHPLFGQTMAQPADLAKYPFILTGADEPHPQTKFRQQFNLGFHVAGLSEHLEEARRLTVLGLGICFLPEAFVSDDVAAGLLHPLLEPGEEPSTEIYIISNPSAPLHRARNALLEHFRMNALDA